MSVVLALGGTASAGAVPAFDPDGDGVVTASEVLDAPLVPRSYLPGADTNGDGAVSLNEGLGRSAPTLHTGVGPVPGPGSVTVETTMRLGQSEAMDGPYSTRWVIGMERPSALQSGPYVYNVFVRNQIAAKDVTYSLVFQDVSGAVYRTSVKVTEGRVSAGAWTPGDSFDPTLVRVTITAP